eukprot:TRINITY_DN15992_c0_g1_i1.p1 TRINITY_DN15992_c0_g1~~TRINITY_DN15992_c0_g1_i1.p1  ORF type:complete len:139 (-),score=31.40 TRINITY_DN15992_c0_g1_i1:62-478(-)
MGTPHTTTARHTHQAHGSDNNRSTNSDKSLSAKNDKSVNMSSENFCLKWNDHHSVFFSNAEKLCHGSLLTDVVISAGGTLFQAHKLVLSVCSKFFQDVFSQPLLPQSPSTVIYLKDVEAKHMQLLLSYMYRGEVDVEV